MQSLVHDWMDLWTGAHGYWPHLGLLPIELSRNHKGLYPLHNHLRSGHDGINAAKLGHHWYNDGAPDYHLSCFCVEVDWPVNLSGFFTFMQIFTFDIEGLGFACVSGSNAVLRYVSTVLFFPVGVCWLALSYFLSQLTKRKWDKAGPA